MKKTVGWREWLALPEWDVPAIKVKLDTGARTSSLHTWFIEPFELEGRQYVRFGLHPLQHRQDVVRLCQAPVIDRRSVRDSGGHGEVRYVVETTVAFLGCRWPIEITLTRRDRMQFRMLLGRSAMAGKLLVDPAASFLGGRGLAAAYNREGGK